MFESFLSHARYALRQLRRSPGFTLTAALTLAIGIGATTAIFSLIWAVMLQPLPVNHPEQLYKIGKKNNCCTLGGMQNDWSVFSIDLYRYFRDHTQGFTSLAAFQSGQDLLSVRHQGDSGKPLILAARYVSGNYFSTFGIPILRGRTITPQDDQEGAPAVAVVSYHTWQHDYALDPSLIGSTVLMNGRGVTIVGVTRPEFYGEKLSSDPPALWIPIHQELNLTKFIPHENPDQYWLDIVGRVAPGTNLAAIEAQLNVELKQWLQSRAGTMRPEERDAIAKQKTELAPAAQSANDILDHYGEGLRLLMYAALAVLFIVCANVASLMLVRTTARRQQTAVCVALGATRSEIVRQTLIVSVTIALIGGLGALAVAYGTTDMMLALAFRGAHYLPLAASPSLPVLAFAFVVSLITGILFGVAPAWLSAHSDPAEALRGANRTSTRDATSTPQRVLVILQAALSVVLLCTAGVLIRSLQQLENQHLGFDMQGRAIIGIDPAIAGVQRADLDVFYRRLRERLSAIPGVSGVSYALYAPMSFDNWSTNVFIPGQPDPKPDSDWYSASYLSIGPGYFDVLGTGIKQGRSITEGDNDSSRHVAVVNETFARRYFHDKAIGQHFGLEPELRSQFEIVGVTEDTKYRSLSEPAPPMFFLPIGQTAQVWNKDYKSEEELIHFAGNIVLRFQGSGAALESSVQAALAGVNPNLAPLYVHTFDEQLGENVANNELIARLCSLFGLAALVLAAIGLYGVTAYSVERRKGEIGIRMALGADRIQVLRGVMRSAMMQVLIGLAIGIPLAYLVGHLLSSYLYQVPTFDPIIVAISVAILSAAAALASLLPAGRAASVDPVKALRTE